MITVQRMTKLGSRNFGVYRGDELIEGGFFSRDAAESVAADVRENDTCDLLADAEAASVYGDAQ